MIDSWSTHNPHHPHFLSPDANSGATSPRSTHLTILTSPASVSTSLSDINGSPLSSPSYSVTSGSSKTNAFFASPFAEGSSSPVPPPNPPTRSSSLKSKSSHISDEPHKLDSRTVPRSLNAEFFGGTSSDYHPTPPASLRSFTTASSSGSPDSSPPASPPAPPRKQLLPPLSRFFPSRQRYSTIDALPSREPSLHRQFLHFDASHAPKSYIPPESSGSRTPSSERDSGLVSVELPQTPPTPDILHAVGPSRFPTPTLSASESIFKGIHTETSPALQPTQPLKEGDVVGDSALSLELVRELGQGAFSSVWLAKDINNQLPALELSRKSSLVRSRSRKRGRSKRLDGTIPPKVKSFIAPRKKPTIGLGFDDRQDSDLSVYLSDKGVGGLGLYGGGIGSEKPTSGVHYTAQSNSGRLVAVKMTDRILCDKNDRSRVSFVREVEVLRHISHPSIVSYLHSFSTPSHHCLVLEHVSGGELFDLIDSPECHTKLDEPLLRRIFGELAKAVGWMHGVGLVHRDIKLENILLTTNPFTSPLPIPPAPLVKLTDFGLSRFIDLTQPLLTTRCGSESYAAPELVTGRAYDGRETDAWACGVVLYALACRRLPFDKPRQSRHREDHYQDAMTRGAHLWTHDDRSERRALLVRIAKAEYSWPELDIDEHIGPELRGEQLSKSEGIRRIVSKLLVRDPKKRSKIIDLWEDEWMLGEGAPLPPPHPEDEDLLALAVGSADPTPTTPDTRVRAAEDVPCSPKSPHSVDGYRADLEGEPEDVQGVDLDIALDALDDGDGVLVDGQEIGPGHVVRQEH
ncbi:hypothetical protein ABKN59_009319 [Abortiporus biennis]